MYDNYTVVVDHLAQMSNTFSDFNAEDRERAANLRTRLVSSKFVICMHVMLDILKEVGKVSVKMQAPSCIILDIPGFYNQLSTAIFSISEFTTPMVSQFLEEYNAAQLRWKGIKLKVTQKIQGVVNEAPEPNIQQQFQSLVGDFLGDLKHTLKVRFGIYTDPESLLSKFQIFNPNNWPINDEDALRAYGNNSLQELLNTSPNEGVGDFFSQEEIREIRHL